MVKLMTHATTLFQLSSASYSSPILPLSFSLSLYLALSPLLSVPQKRCIMHLGGIIQKTQFKKHFHFEGLNYNSTLQFEPYLYNRNSFIALATGRFVYIFFFGRQMPSSADLDTCRREQKLCAIVLKIRNQSYKTFGD